MNKQRVQLRLCAMNIATSGAADAMANSNEWMWPSNTTKHVRMNILWILASICYFAHVRACKMFGHHSCARTRAEFSSQAQLLISRSIHFLLRLYDDMQTTIIENI